MLQALKRDQPRALRSSLLGDASPGSSQSLARETDVTAERNNEGLVQLQQHIMRHQDTELESLDRSVAGTKHIALQINEETHLQNRLLDDLDMEVDATSSRLKVAQRKLAVVMRRAGGCKTQLLLFLMLVILVMVIVIGFKIAINF
jgi:syntaxin of plants SYP5